MQDRNSIEAATVRKWGWDASLLKSEASVQYLCCLNQVNRCSNHHTF